jgi:N6-adenosine-specific RNA methylase IME4
VKDKIGTGYWFRNQHELLLVGTRGAVPAPAPGTQARSVIVAPRGKHSAKPVEVREMIERLYPTLPKIELFARERVPGWDAWGNEIN